MAALCVNGLMAWWMGTPLGRLSAPRVVSYRNRKAPDRRGGRPVLLTHCVDPYHHPPSYGGRGDRYPSRNPRPLSSVEYETIFGCGIYCCFQDWNPLPFSSVESTTIFRRGIHAHFQVWRLTEISGVGSALTSTRELHNHAQGMEYTSLHTDGSNL